MPEKDEILYAGSYQSVFICFGKFWAKGQRPKVCQIDFDHNFEALYNAFASFFALKITIIKDLASEGAWLN